MYAAGGSMGKKGTPEETDIQMMTSSMDNVTSP